LNRLLEARWLSLLIRVFLGLILVYSAWPKIADPPAFAQMIWNYRLLPTFLVNALAVVLPWLEFLVGLALISGLLHRGAALLAGMMLLVFITALTTDLARGIAIDCGCFSVTPAAKTPAELVAGMKLDLLRDSGLLLLACQALFSRTGGTKADTPRLPQLQKN
jgi:uncharacterized membrane protein YphA (DoxX/SURF4 family)